MTDREIVARLTALISLAGPLGDEPPPATPVQAFDRLRSRIGGLAFDLEATRREKGYLRNMLEAAARQDD